MTIPYIRGPGDSLKEALPQLGSALLDIIDPHRREREFIKQKIATDPKYAQELAQLNANDPSAITRMFGDKTAQMLGMLPLSPEAKVTRDIATATGTQLQQPDVRADAGNKQLGLGTTTQRTAENLALPQAELNSKVARAYLDQANLLQQTNPEAYNRIFGNAYYQNVLNMSQKAIRDEELANAAKPIADKYQTKDIATAFLNGDKLDGQQVTPDLIEGIFVRNPNAAKEIFNMIQDEKGLKARLSIAQIQASRGDRSLMDRVYQDTAKRAGQLGLNADALFAAQTDLETLKALRPNASVSPDEIAKARDALDTQNVIQQMRTNSQLRSVSEQITSLIKAGKKPTDALIAQFNSAAQTAGLNLAMNPEGKVYVNGQPQEPRGFFSRLIGDEQPKPVTPDRVTKATYSEKQMTDLINGITRDKLSKDKIKSSQIYKNASPAEQQRLLDAGI